MTAQILSTAPGAPEVLVALEVAWGADLTDLDGSSWTWSDITEDVVLGQGGDLGGGSGISIVLGRPDFSSETQAANMTCQLKNLDGRYSEGGLSENWPNIRRGTPVRVRVSPDGGDTWTVRFQGTSDGFTPQWDAGTGRWATVTLSASGPLRRLNQGTGVMISAMREGTLADSTVVAYLPLDDRQHSTFCAPAVGTARGQFMIVDPETIEVVPGVPGDCASYADIPSSGPIVTLQEGGGIVWNHADLTGSAATVTGIFSNISQLPPGGERDETGAFVENKFGTGQTSCLLTVWTLNADKVKAWAVTYWGNKDASPPEVGSLWVTAYASDPFFFFTDMVVDQRIKYFLRDNTPYAIALQLSQSGTTTNWRLGVREIGATSGRSFTGSVSGNSNGARISEINTGPNGDCPGLVAGHLVVRDSAVNELWGEEWENGHDGEGVIPRLDRLCSTHGIHLEVLNTEIDRNASITDLMGPQYYDTLTNLLRECELTGQGVLFDGLGPGLTYAARGYRAENANGPATLVLDAAEGHLMEPFAPVDDDQQVINHCDVTRRGGTDATYSDLDGPLGVNAIGDYATSVSPNTVTDEGIQRYAEWMVGLGTQRGYRYPSVSFALDAHPDLIADWLACTPQSRIDVENVATVRRSHTPETIKLLIEGWTETIDAFTWRITANTSQAAPWNVIRAAAATGSTGDGICHLDTVSSQLAANAAAGATSITVKTNSGPRWVVPGDIAEGGADNFPFDLDVGGCKVTVTSISGTSTSGQTFTLASPGLPRAFTGSTTTGQGTPVKVWNPPVLGL